MRNNIDMENSVYSMMLKVQIISFLCETGIGKNRVEKKKERGRKRMREAD